MIYLTAKFALDQDHFIYYGYVSYKWDGIESIFGNDRVRSSLIALKDRASFLESKNMLPEKRCLVNHLGEIFFVGGLNEAIRYLSEIYCLSESFWYDDIYEQLTPPREIYDENLYGWKQVEALTP